MTVLTAPVFAEIKLYESPLLLLSPMGWLWLLLSMGFIALVSSSAFVAATARRRARYEMLASLGARATHFRRLLLVELGMPATVGIGIGVIIGGVLVAVLGSVSNVYAGIDRPGLSNVVGSAALIAPPAVLGVVLAARSAAANVGRPRASHDSTNPVRTTRRMRVVGMVLSSVSAVVLLGSVLLFTNSWRLDEDLSAFAWFGIAAGLFGVISGVVMVLPALTTMLTRLMPTKGSRAVTVAMLLSQPRRLSSFTGSMLALTVLVVMGSAGVESDADQYDGVGDGRQAVLLQATAMTRQTVIELAEAHDNEVLGFAALIDVSGIVHRGDGGDDRPLEVAVLTSELAALLDLSSDAVAFVEGGGVLIDSDVVTSVVAHPTPGSDHVALQSQTLRRGGGMAQPGPVVYVSEESLALPPHATPNELVRFAEPISDALTDAFRSQAQTSERAFVSLPNARAAGDEGFVAVLALAGAGLLFALSLAASNLAAVEQDDDFDVQVALGASPEIRPRVLAGQIAWQLALAVGLGVPLSVFLFWVVTRGDPSVPDPIIPGLAIGALVAGAVLATVVVRVMHGPANPAASSRVSSLIEV